MIKSLKNILLLLSICLAVNTTTLSQQFNFNIYSVTEGLGQSQVYTILEDSKGYLWMGTQGGGLSRFDGQNFQVFTNKDSLVNNFIFSLCEDKEQNIWIGTKTGLNVFDGWKMKQFKDKSAPLNSINAMICDESGKIWLGTSRGLYLYKNGVFINYSKENGLPPVRIYSLMEQKNGAVWAGSTLGVWRIFNDKIDFFGEENFLPGTDVTAIVEDNLKRVWVAIFGKGVFQFKGNNFEKLPTKKPLISTNIQSLQYLEDGSIWIGTQDKGVLAWSSKDSTILQLDEQEGLSKNDVRAITQDHWGDVWVGTSGGGVSRYSGQQFLHFDKENGLREEFIYALEKDSLGRVWLSEYDKGVTIFDGRNFTSIAKDSVPFFFISKAIFRDDSNNIWVGTERNGIIIFEQDTIRYLTDSQGIPEVRIRKIIQNKNKEYFVGTIGGGILKLKKDTNFQSGFSIKNLTRNTGLSDDRILEMHLDSLDRLWYATRWNGVGCWSEKGVNFQFGLKDGLPSREVRTMAEDSLGNLWIGTSSGISKIRIYEDSLFVQGKENNEKLTFENIYLLKSDSKNNLWIGSQRGVEKAILDAEGNILETQFFGKSEGFLGIETCQNAVLEDDEGNLWFGTMNGLTKYVSGGVVENEIPPVLQISGIQLFYENLRKTKYQNCLSSKGIVCHPLEFQPSDNHLGFSFLGINLPKPEKVKYQWKLEGAEENWSPPSSQNEVMYPNLLPGEYTFRVKASNESGIWSKPKLIKFCVLPHFWQTWWFQTLGILALFGIFYAIFKIRTNQIKAAAKLEKERLEMEKNLLELEQKALQLQMNPHFIFNALNTIQSQISDKNHRQARYQLAKFSKLMRAILENSREPKITLEQEIKTLESYLALEKFSRGDNFDFEVIYSDDLEIEDIQIPPMMIQPFVENAIIHGVAHLTLKRGKITLKFEDKLDYLECLILDNGVGRKKAQVLKSQIDQQHRSLAMEVTRERLENLDKKGKIEYKNLEISDLEKNTGTKVLLRINL